MTDPFAARIVEVAKRISGAQAQAWCRVLDHATGPSTAVEASLISAQVGSGISGAAGHLLTAWRANAPRLTGPAVALALRAASAVNEEAERQRPRLVISGPTSDAVPVRLTSSVVIDVIRAATDRILVVSFAAHNVFAVVQELDAAAERGVRLDLVLETSFEDGGTLRGRGSAAVFATLVGKANFWHWPAAHRRATSGQAALHAKVVVSDGAVALMSSANLTDRGLTDNIEVGVLVRSPVVASRLEQHFTALMRPEARCLTLVP